MPAREHWSLCAPLCSVAAWHTAIFVHRYQLSRGGGYPTAACLLTGWTVGASFRWRAASDRGHSRQGMASCLHSLIGGSPGMMCMRV